MQILLRKISARQHELAIVRADGGRESATCETRSVLVHDFIHFAVEASAGLDGGFWGSLARGRTLAEMNDRTRPPSGPAELATEMATIEKFVGALHGAAKGIAPADLVAGIRRYAAAMDEPLPAWLTEELVVAVQERLRHLVGAWNATPHGGTMALDW